MIKIFLSYRRADSAQVAGRIFDGLVNAFGEGCVFKDVYNIPYGADLRIEIEQSASQCDVMLAIIGKQWLTIVDDHGRRRLDDPSDYVRNELKTAFSRGIRLIPILVDDAKIPKESELPECLRPLAFLSAPAIRPDPDFHDDFKKMIHAIDPSAAPRASGTRPTSISPLVVATKTVVDFGSRYVAEFLQLAWAPRTFVVERVISNRVRLADSLMFLAVSVLIGWFLEVGFFHGNLWLGLATSLVFSFGLATTYGASLSLAWRIVRGKADTQKMFVVHYYFGGMIQLFMAAWFMALNGAMQAGDAVFYAKFTKASTNGTFAAFLRDNFGEYQNSGALLPVQCVALAGCAGLAFWMWIGWGAYRRLNEVSRVRSLCAAILFVLIFLPVTAAMVCIALAGAAHSSS